MKLRNLLQLLEFALCLLLLSACFEQNIKIGVALPLSGLSTPRGQEILNAVLLAVEDVNQAGGIKGHQVDIVTQDDQDSPAIGREVAEALIKSGVLGVIGHYSSDVTLAALSTYVSAQTALVSPSVSLSHMPAEGQSFFRTMGTNAHQAEVAAEFLVRSGFQRIAIVRNPSLYGQDLATSLQSSLDAYPTIQSRLFKQEPKVLDEIQSFLPEVVFYAGGYQDAAQFLQALREQGLQADFMGGNTLDDEDFIRLAGTKEGQDIWLTSGLMPESFVARYQQRFGRPGPFSVAAYDAARMLLLAAERAESFEPEQVRQALSQLKTYQGIGGDYALDGRSQQLQQADFRVLELGAGHKFRPAIPIQPRFGALGQRLGQLALKDLKPPKPAKKPN